MKIVYDPIFLERLKKLDVRIRKSTKKRMLLFSQNPHYPQLDNHELRDEYQGYRSINITGDYRALYSEVIIGKEKVAYFVILGTHDELYDVGREELS